MKENIPYRYFIANKPYNMICQFTAEEEGQITLAHLNFDFPKDVYPIGRLDLDSEGLLLLTNDRTLNHTLLNPQFAHERTYLAQVEGIISYEALHLLQNGLEIKIEKKLYHTLPCKANRIDDPSVYFAGNPIWERNPPAKASANKPMSWLEITLTEGKNRQVRRMCAKVLHPCLRLIRVGIVDLTLGDLQPNNVIELEKEFIYNQLKIK
jgi:23S rRNA pseudouridine2457 synthase